MQATKATKAKATTTQAMQAPIPLINGPTDYDHDDGDFTICDANGVVVKCITGTQKAYANYCAGLEPIVCQILKDLANATGKPLVKVLYPNYDQYLANSVRHHAECHSFYHVLTSFGFACNLTAEATKTRDVEMYKKACLVWQLKRREFFPSALNENVPLDAFKALLLKNGIAVYNVNNFLTTDTTEQLSARLNDLINTY